MKHGNAIRTFGRVRRQRTALIRGLAVSLIERGKIKTTEAKAKELRPFIERLVTKAKAGGVADKRLIAARLGEPKQMILKKLVWWIILSSIQETPSPTRSNGFWKKIV